MDATDHTNHDYLGDGVYLSFDGYHVWVHTNSIRPKVYEHSIALEPGLPEKIVAYYAEIVREHRAIAKAGQ